MLRESRMLQSVAAVVLALGLAGFSLVTAFNGDQVEVLERVLDVNAEEVKKSAATNSQWWKVDLGKGQCISKVTIHYLGESCSESLKDAFVVAGTGTTTFENQPCGAPITASQARPPGGSILRDCRRPIWARYVYIYILVPATSMQGCEGSVDALSGPHC
ncbi:fucolectin-5-like [Acanthaster planci]|uniref:Fucolectin-5-like n=1 Tax=Acanthaster planci TaxID=133434 RepID=A0A8B7ZHK5_ACAPL|nr:fucolectin-5-like [Acanthaster planci]